MPRTIRSQEYVPAPASDKGIAEPATAYGLQQVLVSAHDVAVLEAARESQGSIRRLLASTASSAIFQGDVRQILRNFPPDTFTTCVTSPPYWSLRDYGLEEQIGLEDSVYS